jgi:hypothetical protein
MYPAKKGPAFTHWLTLLDRHAKKTGLDACFFVLLKNPGESTLLLSDTSKTSELYLLTSFGQISLEDIQVFDKAIMSSPCQTDQLNNRMASEFLRGSVCPEMQKLFDQELPIDVSAAYMLWHIIQKVQGVNSTAGRLLFKQIEVM